jgi:hypothetical protein
MHIYNLPKALTNSLIVTDWSLGYRSAKPFLDRCSIQGKSNMAFKIIPIERKQSIQIDILESLQAYIWFAGCTNSCIIGVAARQWCGVLGAGCGSLQGRPTHQVKSHYNLALYLC